MSVRRIARVIRIALFISLAAALMGGQTALAQYAATIFTVTSVATSSISVEWKAVPGVINYSVSYEHDDSGVEYNVGATSDTSSTVTGLQPNTRYRIIVRYGNVEASILVRTAKEKRSRNTQQNDDDDRRPESEIGYAPPPKLTCPYLPPSVEVFGYVHGTQCQILDAAGVGNMDAINRGFINAVDIWNYVNGGIEVCFRYGGALLFLDAAYAPRLLTELSSFQRDGMTCGKIDGPGTVVLVQSAPPSAPAVQTTPPPPGELTLPIVNAIPTSDCQIKLQETLFLRAAPAGEIIGLVWLYSEVPVFEVNGDWFKVEFEGKIGYISRHYHRVLRGGCA